MQKVLVTGAAGFIGRSVVRILRDRNYRVIGLDNFRFSNQSQINRGDPGVEWVEGDTRDKRVVARVMNEADHVIHLAAPSSFIMHEEDDLEACTFTMVGFKTVMECLKARGLRKIVWASTSAVYEVWGKPPRVPFREDMPIDPPDSKAGCKWWCEQEAQRYSNRYGITSIAFRPFSVYGVGEHTKLGYANITSLFSWALMAGRQLVVWGDGKQTRDFIFVEDAARAFVDAMEKDLPTTTLNLGFGIEHSFNDVIAIVEGILGVKADVKYVPVPIQIYAYRLWADTTKIEHELGFRPRVTLEEGIRRIIKAARALPPDERGRLNLEVQQHYFEKLNTHVAVA